MQKFSKIIITPKKKNSLMEVRFNKTSVGMGGNQLKDAWSRKSNQLMSKDLNNCIERLIPHLMFASELADRSLKLDKDMDYNRWFEEFLFTEDKRFDGVVITSVQFIGKDTLDAVKLYGYKETEFTDKPFKVKIETPVISLVRTNENSYPLVAILDTQIDTLQHEIEEWLERGKTVTQAEFKFLESVEEKKVDKGEAKKVVV